MSCAALLFKGGRRGKPTNQVSWDGWATKEQTNGRVSWILLRLPYFQFGLFHPPNLHIALATVCLRVCMRRSVCGWRLLISLARSGKGKQVLCCWWVALILLYKEGLNPFLRVLEIFLFPVFGEEVGHFLLHASNLKASARWRNVPTIFPSPSPSPVTLCSGERKGKERICLFLASSLRMENLTRSLIWGI